MTRTWTRPGARAREIGARILARLEKIQAAHPELIGDVRGLGPMLVMEVVEDPVTRAPAMEATAAITAETLKRGVITIRAGLYSNCVRFLPPLTIDDAASIEGFRLSGSVTTSIASIGPTLACVAALEALDTIARPEFLARARQVGGRIRARLEKIQSEHAEIIGDVRGLGPMLAMEVVTDAESRKPSMEATDSIMTAPTLRYVESANKSRNRANIEATVRKVGRFGPKSGGPRSILEIKKANHKPPIMSHTPCPK